MAADARDELEDEWEYEYSTTETETFYVDLDLSSVNGVIKSKNAGDRKSLKRGAKSVANEINSRKSDQARPNEAEDAQDDDNENEDERDVEGGRENDETQGANSPSQAQSPREPGLLDDDYMGRMQILDFHTTNPIISYNGHIYSCTWHDMLGTTMFITKHQETPFHEPEISTEDYDLIGTTRLKLVGQRAKILPKAGSKKRRRAESEEAINESGEAQLPSTSATAGPKTTVSHPPSVLDGKSLGTITRTNPKINIEIKQQAMFLEKLMDLKKTRGETDTVRTFVDRRTVAADARQARKAKKVAKAKDKEMAETAEQRLRREINELNRRVVKGDNDALERLQEIYADMEEVEDDENDVVFIGDAPAPAATATATIASTGSAPALVKTRTDTVDAGNNSLDPAAEGSNTKAPHVPDSDPNGAASSAALH